MDTISIFLKIIFENIDFILPITIIFLLITSIGVVITLTLVNEDRWSLILPLGVAVGIFSFIIFLGTLSYFFKARPGILVILIIYILFGIFFYKKRKYKIPKIKFDRFFLKSFPIYFVISGLVAFLAGTTQYGGDVIAYWGFATSFANGNYPLRSPWQPDILANHHQGTYLFEGAIHALTNADMMLIHTLYSIYIVLSGIFLIWAIVRKITKRDILSVVPALTVYFSFGAIFIPLLSVLRQYLHPEVEHIVTRLPLLLDAKNRLGGMSNLPDMIYINHRAAALLGFILVLYLIYTKLKVKGYWKPIIIAAFSVAIASSDEIYLPALVFMIGFWFIREMILKPKFRKATFTSFFLGTIIFIILFFLIGNALRDSMLTPPKEGTRFRIITSMESLLQRNESLKSAILRNSSDSSYFWFLPSVWVLGALALFLAISKRNYLVMLLFFATIGSFIAFFIVDHTFYATNNERFLSQLYQHLVFIISMSSLLLLKGKSRFLRLLAKLFLFVLVVPSIVFASVFIYKYAKKPAYNNLYGKISDDKVLLWLRTNKPKERVFFVDGFLWKTNDPYLTNHGIQNFGLFVPVAPADIKVHTPDFGVEAIDVINTLNPSEMKALKITYLYVLDNQVGRFPLKRQKDLENQDYFKKVYKDNFGSLYQVSKQYYEKGENMAGTISELSEILKGGNIFLDNPPNFNFYVRAALALELKDKENVYSVWGPGIFNYIETKIILKQPEDGISYDYIVVGPDLDPKAVCKCNEIVKIWEINQAVAYKVR